LALVGLVLGLMVWLFIWPIEKVPMWRLVRATGPDEGSFLLVLGAWKEEPRMEDLKALVPGPLRAVRYKKTEIVLGAGSGPLSAYSLCRGSLLVGTDGGTLKGALDEQEGRFIGIKANPPYGGDITFSADNRNLKFSNFLRTLKDKWKMSLLLSADHLEWVGASLDVVDQDRVKGSWRSSARTMNTSGMYGTMRSSSGRPSEGSSYP